jgi:CRISPR/Cas system-associated exonuclease Cas4 (RecB family)
VLGWPEPNSLNLTRGSAGHHALELNARHKLIEKLDQSAEQIIDTFTTRYDKDLADFSKDDFQLGDNPGKDKDLTVETLRMWRLDPSLAVARTPQAVELDFTIPIPPDESGFEMKPVTGKIDVVETIMRVLVPRARPVQRTEIVDYKFPARLPSNLQLSADISPQPTIYDYVATQAGTQTQDVGYIHFVPPTKTIPARIIPVYRSKEELTPERRAARHERILMQMRNAAKTIAAGNWNFQDDPRVCASCPYRKVCQGSLAKDDYTALQLTGRHA